MLTLSLFDNRTLFASNFIITTVFAALFFGVTRIFPYVRGMRPVALSFLLALPACLLMGARGQIPYFVSVVVANFFVLLSFFAMAGGIARFCDGRRWTRLLGALVIATTAGLTWFTVIHDSITTRIVLMAIATGALRGVAAYNLMVRSPASANRRVMRLFSLFLWIIVVSSLARSLMIAWNGTTRAFLEENRGLTVTLTVNLIYLSVSGCCFLLLASSELITSSRLDSECDVLTGMLNRRGIEQRLQRELDQMKATGQPLSVCLLDMDLLKSINDDLGHAAGDAALRMLAQALRTSLRGCDHVGRYGGDEFLLVLPQTGARDIPRLRNRLQYGISELPALGERHKVAASLGFEQAQAADTGTSLIARADAALYVEKSLGKGNKVLPVEVNAARDASEQRRDGLAILESH